MRPSWWYAALFLLASAGPRGLKHDWTRVDRFTLGGQLCCGQFLYAVKLPSWQPSRLANGDAGNPLSVWR